MSDQAVMIPKPAQAPILTFRWADTAGSVPAGPTTTPTTTLSAAPSRWPSVAPDRARWVPLGQPADLGRVRVPGGGLYVGEHLAPLDPRAPAGPSACLIRPTLAIDWARPNDAGDLGYWPSYSDLDARSRAGYLRFLADGAQHPQAPSGFVFLYVYGLERRLLINLASTAERGRALSRQATGPSAESVDLARERAGLLGEVQRLLGVYRRHHSLQRYLGDLVNVSWWADAPSPGRPPQFANSLPKQASFALALGLGRLVAAGLPIPGEWAWAWWRTHPATGAPMALQRCPAEFHDLFLQVHAVRHGDGLVLPAPRQLLSVFYNAASPDLPNGWWVRTDAADVTLLAEPLVQIAAVAAEVNAKLRRYSRRLGQQPDQAASPQTMWLLPDELRCKALPDAAPLTAWIRGRLAASPACTASVRDLIEVWTGDAASPAALVDLQTAVAVEGFGVQADVRWRDHVGTPAGRVGLVNEPCDLGITVQTGPGGAIKVPGESADTGLTLEEAATVLEMLIDVAALWAAPDNSVLDDLALLVSGEVPVRERVRLHALALLINERPLPASVLRRRVRALNRAARDRLEQLIFEGPLAHRLLQEASQDGVRHLKQLLRATATASPTAPQGRSELARVRLSGHPPVVHALPERSATPPGVSSPATERLVLDRVRVEAVRRDTDTVGLLLERLFRDEQESDDERIGSGQAESGPGLPPPSSALASEDAGTQPGPVHEHRAAPPAVAGAVAGLDVAHRSLLCDLNARSSWSRREAGALAAVHGLLPAAALDRLNEAALELTGACASEGQDPIDIHTDIIEEMREHQHQHQR